MLHILINDGRITGLMFFAVIIIFALFVHIIFDVLLFQLFLYFPCGNYSSIIIIIIIIVYKVYRWIDEMKPATSFYCDKWNELKSRFYFVNGL